MSLIKRCIAEFFGTFWLVFGGCGSAIFAASFIANATEKAQSSNSVPLGIGFVGVALAFGLTVLTMAYAIGHISGCHLNPAVSFGLWAGKRFPGSELLPYIIAQVVGAVVASIVLFLIASGKPGFEVGGFAANGYDLSSPGKYSMTSAFMAEFVLTYFFLMVILGSTDRRAPAGFAPVAIGLTLTLIHLISIPITNTSVNPARSTGPAIFAGTVAISQLWLFWVAPILGAIAAGFTYSTIFGESKAERNAAEVYE
jgi:aquaporin Z